MGRNEETKHLALAEGNRCTHGQQCRFFYYLWCLGTEPIQTMVPSSPLGGPGGPPAMLPPRCEMKKTCRAQAHSPAAEFHARTHKDEPQASRPSGAAGRVQGELRRRVASECARVRAGQGALSCTASPRVCEARGAPGA